MSGKAHRKLRQTFNEPGHAHELTFSCLRRWPLLSRGRTRQWLIETLDAARKRWSFDLWAYVIMPGHVHLLIQPLPEVHDIALILKAIKQPVARRAVSWLKENSPQWLHRLRVDRSNGKVEYRFWQQGGGYDRNITNTETAWAAIEYIHANPVRRGLVDHPTDWPWSSAVRGNGRCCSSDGRSTTSTILCTQTISPSLSAVAMGKRRLP